jgi:hypothetical protein
MGPNRFGIKIAESLMKETIMTALSRVWIAAYSPLVSNTSMFVPTIMQTWNDDEAIVMDECHQETYRTDADGTITGYTHITNSTDASGATYSWTNHYDADWALTEAGYSDSSGYSSLTQYLTSTDADGTITGYTHITNSTDASGATYSWTNHYDANWALTEAGYGALEEVLNGGVGTEVPTDCADVDKFVFIFEAECNGFCAVETHSLEEFITDSIPRDFETQSDDDAFIMNSLVYLGDAVAASDNIMI